MTSTPLLFSLLRYQPDMQRQEVVNVGVVVFTASGPSVSLATNQGKLLALDPNFRITRLYSQGERLQKALRSLWEENPSTDELVRMFGAGGSLSLSPTGMLDARGRSVESIVKELQHDLVLAPVRTRTRERQPSRLHTELRQLFKQGGILGSKPDDISRHLVVPNFPIDPEIGLFAEFALRNGKLHVTETIDFRTSTLSAKKQEAQAKTLILVEALERLGATDLRRYVVVTGASSQVQASMNLLERYSDDFVVRESAQDWQRYVDLIHNAARQPDSRNDANQVNPAN